jgi:tetratricopeptide (TPR) repeat protein
MNPINDLPQRSQSHDTQVAAETAFKAQIEEAGFFIVQAEDRADYGTDFQIEARCGTGMTNFRIHVQLKGTNASVNSDESISVSLPRRNLNYLLAQPESIYVCYHVPNKSIWVRYAADVYHEYEHRDPDWQRQEAITVRFSRPFDPNFQQELNQRLLATGREERDWRLHWAGTPPDKYSSVLRKAVSIIPVPHEAQQAKAILANLFDDCEDAAISKAFPKFAAVLNEMAGDMDLAYMAEVNLGLRGAEFSEERVKRAIEVFGLGFSRGLDHPGGIHYCIGNCWLALMDYPQAITAYDSALSLLNEPKLAVMAAKAFKNKGSAHEKLTDFDTARICFEEALKLDSDLFEAHFALGLWHKTHGDNIHLASHHLAQAIPELASPELAITPRAWMIELDFQIGDATAAFKGIRMIQGFSRECEWVLPWCASLVAQFGRLSLDSAAESRKFWRSYLRRHPDDTHAQREEFMCLSLLHSRGTDTGVDLDAFRQLASKLVAQGDSESALIWDRVGHWAQDEGNWHEAESSYRKAFEIDPIQFGYCLGTSLNFLAKHVEALPILLAQAELYLMDAMSWFQVAIAREGTSDPEGCISAYKQALNLDPNYDLAWFNLGGVFWNNDRFVEAMETWSEALHRFPEHKLAGELLKRLPSLSKN